MEPVADPPKEKGMCFDLGPFPGLWVEREQSGSHLNSKVKILESVLAVTGQDREEES